MAAAPKTWATSARAIPTELGEALREFRSARGPRSGSPDEKRLEAAGDARAKLIATMSGIEAIWRQNCHALPNEKEPLASAMGSAIRRSKAAAFPEQIRRNSRSRR